MGDPKLKLDEDELPVVLPLSSELGMPVLELLEEVPAAGVPSVASLPVEEPLAEPLVTSVEMTCCRAVRSVCDMPAVCAC